MISGNGAWLCRYGVLILASDEPVRTGKISHIKLQTHLVKIFQSKIKLKIYANVLGTRKKQKIVETAFIFFKIQSKTGEIFLEKR